MSFNEWREVVLSDVIQFNPRETIKKGTICKKIGMDKLDPHTRKINGYEEISFTSGTKFRNGDTLLARITPCLENGKTAQVTILDDNEVAFGSTEFIVMREKLGETINDFIYYLSISEEFRGIAIKSMTGTSGRQRAQKDVIENSTIKLPPIEKQRAIANILSTLDDKIEINNKINQKLEELEQAIFKQWFIDFDFPNEYGKPYKSSGGEMVESELGMIPKGWEVVRLEEIAEIKTTSVKPQNSQNTLYEHYSIPAYDDKKYPVFEEGKYIKSNKYKVYNDSILVSKLNPDTKRVWKPIVLTENAICSTEFINYVPRETIFESLLYSIVDSQNFIDYLCQHVTGSTGSRQRANPKSSYNYQLAITKDNEKIKLFSNAINCINLRIRNNRIETNKLTKLRDTLLPKLMSGEIKVPINKEK
ncbi:restriction endonuclease S subunit [[Clostridium] sordellii]|uniref:restriction endonuclease subunit S n=1 Tax=Paraclostridium sordellii TaxID=1505 RepID=UPI0005E42342|nr:restriction endonuclease subunit S [Paeniclostridium sordellii]CEQ22089.1 restriction endonuclease S subunit [[Clostridium] sordellii] [Paeniclostridium sordellii]